MEGHGVTNYNTEKPSYGYTTQTTQFDDALLQHGVVNRTQTITAKGASVAVAQALLQQQQESVQQEKQQARQQQKPWYYTGKTTDSDEEGSDYDDLLQDNDDVMERYRVARLQQYQEITRVPAIRRDDWTTRVNEASQDCIVLVCLTTTAANESFVQACARLAERHAEACQFVTLPATEALGDWPHPEPSILIYRYGVLWRECLRLTAWSVDDLERTLSAVWDVLE